MLDVKIFMNSSVEEVLAFKCCNLPDQNLEIHVINKGNTSTSIQHYFILENEKETFRCDNLYPPWKQTIEPGSAVAYYCSFDPLLWDKYRFLTIFDCDGNPYRFSTKSE